MKTTEKVVHKSRWGYHPCSYETYLKLKELNKVYCKAQRMAAEWNRWARKDKHNRVVRKKVRNPKGQVMARPVVGQRPEPSINNIFVSRDPKKDEWAPAEDKALWWLVRRTSQTYYCILKDRARSSQRYKFATNIWVDSHGIDVAYRHARFPEVSEDQVSALAISEKEIDALYKKLKETDK